jgi:hypothetical protein
MEVPQGNSSCSYLKQAKMLSYLFFFFSYTKSENRRAEQVLCGGLVAVGGGMKLGNSEGG